MVQRFGGADVHRTIVHVRPPLSKIPPLSQKKRRSCCPLRFGVVRVNPCPNVGRIWVTVMGGKLTDRSVKAAPPGRHMDGTVRGLTLLVWPTGARSWVVRYQLH